jgi:predicted RecA/RadA family phage recombinase
MAITETGDRNFQHFSASPGDTVVFSRVVSVLVITVPTGGSVSIDFEGSADADGVSALALGAGTHHFTNFSVKTILVSGSSTITGVGVST